MRLEDPRAAHLARRFLLAAVASLSTVAYAGPGVWTSGGPYGGTTPALAIDPSSPSTLYAGTGGHTSFRSARAGVFKSTDAANTWAAANSGLTSQTVGALAIDPSTPSTLYAGGYGVFKSTDAGDTWAAAGTGLTYHGVFALAIDPSTPSTLYAGTYVAGVFKSTDAGDTWATANTGLTNLQVQALAISPSNPATLYAGTFGGGVFKSTDSGGTWVPANAGLLNLTALALAINTASPDTLYTGTDGGVFKSTNSGGSWTAANTGLTNLEVRALVISPSNSATLYAGTIGGGVFKSTDSGGTWAAANTGLADPDKDAVLALAVNPSNPSTLYAGTFRSGVFKSTDAGGTWAAANTGLRNLGVVALAIDPSNPSTLYAGTDRGAFKSTDSGGAWATANTGLFDPNVTALAIDPSTPSTLYAGGYHQVFKSTDSGGTWAATSLQIPWEHGDVVALAINPANPTTLYAGEVYGLLFKSTDAGDTWAAADRGLAGFYILALAIDTAAPDTLYTGTDGGVFKSTDAGDTWAAAGTGLTDHWVFALAIDPSTTPSTLYAGAYDGVFKSTDAGGTWVAATTGMTDLFVLALGIDPSNPSTLYAGTYDGGVFRSTDSGGTWAAVNAGLPYLPVDALALDPTGATTLYAGLGSGVWQSTPATLSTTALLPTSAHSPGANGAFFTTVVSVANLGASTASFTLKFLGNNQDGSNGPEQSFNLEPGTSSTYIDVLASVFDLTSNSGAIRITSNSPTLGIVSVTSTPGFGGTFGQTIPAVSFADLIPAGSSRSILYIREGDGFRSNLILASGSFVLTDIDVALVSPTGSTLATKTYSVPPNGMTQVNRVVRDMGVSGPITGARLVLSSSTTGAAFTGLASVIDETTNDPTTVVAQPASASGASPYTWLIPASAHSNGANGAFYTTNVAVANVGALPSSFTMKFLGHNQDGSGGPERTFNLASGSSVTYFDVLGSVFDQTSSFGALRISSDSPFLNIVSVTSTPGFGGTLGQTVAAVPSSDLVPTSSSRSILYIREGDGYRTNLVLASDASVATTVDASLVSPAGAVLAARTYVVPPSGMTQINRVVRDMGVPGPVTGARLVLSYSTPYAAIASVIDEITNDPTTVEAQ